MSIALDWANIRPLNGGRDKGFEELCAQLAAAETPEDAQFVRKGTPDAGVECYAILSDGSEWGWQSKYFDALGDTQWAQINKSVRTAIDKHPRLTRYFVCVPLDRADARISGQKSAKEKWDDHKATWEKSASDAGRQIEFIYWGSHELLKILSRTQHVGRVRFWFDARRFDPAWFSAKLEEALQTAGPRYTPEVHVDLPIASEFDAFGRTSRFFDEVKANARRIRERSGDLRRSSADPDDVALSSAEALASKQFSELLEAFGSLRNQQTGPLPIKALSERALAARASLGDLAEQLHERERADVLKERDSKPKSSYQPNPIRDRRLGLERLYGELYSVAHDLSEVERIANSTILVLRGPAGSGKTHLLCDIARQRVAANRPTILLMGQRFVSHDAPWTQALQQLDIAGLSAEEFVGALEAAAQAMGSRALLMLDAINEGAGRELWPANLGAFLTQIERSPWISVVLSIRSSYETIVIPEEIRLRSAALTHRGFADHEYNATKAFFLYYGLELPSTPLLAPEFRNPLFLKTLCIGLSSKSERRLPRGMHGITAIFGLYLDAVNARLSTALDFDQRTDLVRKALEKVAGAFGDPSRRWVDLSKAKEVVDSLLPGRSFERSLYRGLVSEGVLVEDARQTADDGHEDLVYIGYERLADHLVARALLDTHLDEAHPARAFEAGAPMGFVCERYSYVPPGLIEALCVQIPERIGKELVEVAPKSLRRPSLKSAFRQSLVWRKLDAVTDSTREIMGRLCQTDNDLDETVEVLLTIAILPDHPLSARFLHQRLRDEKMPDRDAWWSLFLFRAWDERGAVRRMVDWASSVTPTTRIEQEAVDLCAISLSWMLTTSHRALRDRATKALVSLLTQRLSATTMLIQQFADVDDPYVLERVYAVAYGVAMRTHDPAALAPLAAEVYARVFETGCPPPHILLRDYARGVVERALHLGSQIKVAVDRIRPPYGSPWPNIPSEDAIKGLLPLWADESSHDSGSVEWARHIIGSSVTDGDFARYVIGTNSSSTDWLSLKLDEPPWIPPPAPQAQLSALAKDFSADEQQAWSAFQVADAAYEAASGGRWGRLLGDTMSDADLKGDVAVLKKTLGEALSALMTALTEPHAQQLVPILRKISDGTAARAPRFDLKQIQRYVLWRVFDLGWTSERFGHFDRFTVRSDGRNAHKGERIGKKYQWIAYHEILALVADNFQYKEEFRDEEGDQAYEGPWQLSVRDIDPSCTVRALRGGDSWKAHSRSWWATEQFDNWGEGSSPDEWIRLRENLPNVARLLIVKDPDNSANWLNCECFFSWKQPVPADQDPYATERRELWYICSAHLIASQDVSEFLRWAQKVDFMGRWMPEPPTQYRMFLGEHAWAPASRYFEKPYYGDGWSKPERNNCPVNVRTIGIDYLKEASGYDCSIDESYTLHIPVGEIVRSTGIKWHGDGADFADANGLSAQDPAVTVDGPGALLIKETSLRPFLEREKLSVCWTIIGEKQALPESYEPDKYHPPLGMSGAYALSNGRLVGFLKHSIAKRSTDGDDRLQSLGIVRTDTQLN